MYTTRARAVFLAASLLAAGCSSHSGTTQATKAPTVAPAANPVRFPLFSGASIVSEHAFRQLVHVLPSPPADSVFASGSGTYTGHEVIASSTASFARLETWLSQLQAKPPHGYSSADTADSARQSDVERYGIAYAAFRRAGTRQGVLVVAMDPLQVEKRFGTVLGMIAKYQQLPGVMRAPVDAAIKARTGLSVTQALQPDSPIGAALAALDQFQEKSQRGIVVIDAAKK